MIFYKHHNNSLFDVISDKVVAYYRNVDRNPNLVCQFQASEAILSMKNVSEDFLCTQQINLFLDDFSKKSVVFYKKIDVYPNLVTLF